MTYYVHYFLEGTPYRAGPYSFDYANIKCAELLERGITAWVAEG